MPKRTIESHPGRPYSYTQGQRASHTHDETEILGLRTVVTVTGTYVALVTDDTILADATAGAFTITLPTAVGNTGKTYFVKKIDSTSSNVTLDGAGSETIDGSATRVISLQYEAFTIQSDGSVWWIL